MITSKFVLVVSLYCVCALFVLFLLRNQPSVVAPKKEILVAGQRSIVRHHENQCVIPILQKTDNSISRLLSKSSLPQCDPISENVPNFATLNNNLVELTPKATEHCQFLEYREIYFFNGDKVKNKIFKCLFCSTQ
jgi:hypothetical protein